MNCKPGDLAVIVRSESGNAGRIVEVLRASHHYPNHWWVRLSHPAMNHFRMLVTEVNCADANLRPIRDPGDDAQDESFRWAPAPEKATA
jgi:hypothetical protein